MAENDMGDAERLGFVPLERLCELFNVQEETIKKAMRRGMPCRRVGKWYFSIEALHKWFEAGLYDDERTAGIGYKARGKEE